VGSRLVDGKLTENRKAKKDKNALFTRRIQYYPNLHKHAKVTIFTYFSVTLLKMAQFIKSKEPHKINQFSNNVT